MATMVRTTRTTPSTAAGARSAVSDRYSRKMPRVSVSYWRIDTAPKSDST
jgi:hypothetical protein